MAIITGTNASNRLTGTSAKDIIKGLAGRDIIQGRSGNDILYGGKGNDVIIDSRISDVGEDYDLLYGGDGNDRLISYQGSDLTDADTLYGGKGNDRLVFNGTQTDDKAFGGAGRDSLVLNFAASTQTVSLSFKQSGFLVQLAGSDTVFATGMERLEITTGNGNDLITGSARNDFIYSSGGADTLKGGAGNDRIGLTGIAFDGPAVSLHGGQGVDILDMRLGGATSFNASLDFDLQAGRFLYSGNSLGKFGSFERLWVLGLNLDDRLAGGQRADSLNGFGGNDVLIGRGGNDLLRGDSGDDTLFGGAGNDTLIGDSGTNILNGGKGDDLFIIRADDTLQDSGGIDTVKASFGLRDFDMKANAFIENFVNGTDSSMNVTGNARDNVIRAADRSIGFDFDGSLRATGGGGNDRMIGGRSFDSLNGENGNDRLWGNERNDTLWGGVGADRLYGGLDDDTLYGGGGNDLLWGDSLRHNPGVGFGSGKLVKTAAEGVDKGHAIDLTDLFSLKQNRNIVDATEVPHVSVTGTLREQSHGFNTETLDWYKVTVKAGAVIFLDIDRAGMAGKLYTKVTISNADFSEKTTAFLQRANDPGSESDAYDGTAQMVARKDGTYFIQVLDQTYSERSGDKYVLHVSIGNLGGNDTLDGGRGRDVLNGGLGADLFVFAKGYGKDRIVDFQNDVDTIQLNHNLWSGNLTTQEVVTKFAHKVGANMVLDFGNDELTLKGFTNRADLVDDLQIV